MSRDHDTFRQGSPDQSGLPVLDAPAALADGRPCRPGITNEVACSVTIDREQPSPRADSDETRHARTVAVKKRALDVVKVDTMLVDVVRLAVECKQPTPDRAVIS